MHLIRAIAFATAAAAGRVTLGTSNTLDMSNTSWWRLALAAPAISPDFALVSKHVCERGSIYCFVAPPFDEWFGFDALPPADDPGWGRRVVAETYAAVDRDALVDCGAADGELRVVVHVRLGDLLLPDLAANASATALTSISMRSQGGQLRNALASSRSCGATRARRTLILSDSPPETVAATLEGWTSGYASAARGATARRTVDGRTAGLEKLRPLCDGDAASTCRRRSRPGRAALRRELLSKKKAAEAPVVPAVRIADCRYEKLAYREGGSRVECFRWGERARLCGVRIVHASRILPGHFGHDMLNNYLYVFNTIWELNLTHWMDWGKLRHVVDDAVRSKLGEQLVETMQYSRAEQPVGYNVTQLGAATARAELIFRRSSPSRLKKVFWRDYRDMFARKFCAGCDHRQATRPLRGRCPAKKLNVVLTRRTHDPASSRVMFANGRGRRILNNDALAKALGAFGRVRNVDRAACRSATRSGS
ncbi:hypothetical protein JL720_14703 [Aureococcus anophagefferens]|nr:hypothetical protein JL720_14703 [Aureococcus anophagefferens]